MNKIVFGKNVEKVEKAASRCPLKAKKGLKKSTLKIRGHRYAA
jgi:hypothetical protein